MPPVPSLCREEILSRLPHRRWLREVLVFGKTSSTNDIIGKLAREKAPEGIAAFAEEQTAGRGRLGRVWESETAAGLWFSLLLRPTWPLAHWTRLTLWAARAVALGIESATGVEISLKWPNDLYLGGRKLAGLLVESSPGGENAFAVAGIGINVNQESFPEPIAARATSLRLETGAALDRNELAARVLAALDRTYFEIPSQFSEILAWARQRDFLQGKFITAALGNERREGIASGLDEDGSLLLRRENGSVEKISSGEVTRIQPGAPGE